MITAEEWVDYLREKCLPSPEFNLVDGEPINQEEVNDLKYIIKTIQDNAIEDYIIPSNWQLVQFMFYKNSANEPLYVCDLLRLSDGYLVSTNCYKTPLEALKKAIELAKTTK